jgi:hypothetical protein
VRALEKHDFKAAGKLGNILTITVSEGPPSKE